MTDYKKLLEDPISRRTFLARLGSAGLGVTGVALLAGCGGNDNATNNQNPNPNPGGDSRFPGIPGSSIDIVVLNFALTLETLEADLYRQALNKASGRPLTQPLDGQSTIDSAVTNPPASQSTGSYTLSGSIATTGVLNAQAAFLYLVQYAYVEMTHRDFLRTVLGALGATAVPRNAGGYHFPNGGDPGSSLGAILTNIYPLEETGVRAYLGAAPALSGAPNGVTPSTNGVAQVAASIYSTEARHSAGIAYILGQDSGPISLAGDLEVAPSPSSDFHTFEKFLTPATVLTTASQTYFG